MSHPKNKRERLRVANTKARRRVSLFFTDMDKEQQKAYTEKHLPLYRDTTTKCSAMCCGNPRKFFNQKTLQERKYLESYLRSDGRELSYKV